MDWMPCWLRPAIERRLQMQLARLLADTELATWLGNNGRRLYEREFTMDKFTSRFGTIYARLCDRAA